MAEAQREHRSAFRFRHRLASGEVRHVEVYSEPVSLAGRELLHSVVFDIEDRVRAERQLHRLSTAVEQSPATVVITDTSGNIEYTNPAFTTSTGYTAEEALGKNPRILKTGDTPEEKYRRLWRTITTGGVWRGEFLNRRKDGGRYWEDAVNKANATKNRLLENLIDWSRSQTGRIRFEPRRLDLFSEVDEVISPASTQAHAKEVALKNEVPPGTEIHADRAMLNAVLRNLLSNAVKFSHRSGTVHIRARTAKDGCEVSVVDHGVGVSEEHREKLFGAMSEVQNTGTEDEQGSGLGLVLCREFVERHGGAIRAESTEGVGTTIAGAVPRTPPLAYPDSPRSSCAPPGGLRSKPRSSTGDDDASESSVHRA